MKDFLTVYISKIPEKIEISEVFPESRNLEILSCRNPVVQKERFWAWKILEKALWESYVLPLEAANISKSQSGKWVSDKCNFSISHSHGLVAVAVSSVSVGVDIENWNFFEKKNFNLKMMIKKFLSEEEQRKYVDAAEKRKFLELWTKKEAVFKENPPVEGFYSRNIELNEEKIFTKYDSLDDIEYCVSVCSALKDSVEFK